MIELRTNDEATIRRRSLDRVRRIVDEVLEDRGARVYLFGSCARGDWRHGSDIDLAVDPVEALPAGIFARINQALEESTVPYFVDVVDMAGISPAFADRIRTEGILWRS
ncbi:nucleotidyltransferase domain-containing protein [Inquilinus sp. CAU 1745]|uniref:nucleotidyltransferase family protein n=1 Tax=Inquilinus sp. CAU 1745 TaxID=3140369 RepID=UPI00325A90EA